MKYLNKTILFENKPSICLPRITCKVIFLQLLAKKQIKIGIMCFYKTYNTYFFELFLLSTMTLHDIYLST